MSTIITAFKMIIVSIIIRTISNVSDFEREIRLCNIGFRNTYSIRCLYIISSYLLTFFGRYASLFKPKPTASLQIQH